MDLTNINNTLGYPDPIQMPVSELITGSYVFNIPSYQRGYRWESNDMSCPTNDVKQVDDLLEDLTTFVSNNPSGNYYLQPLMVKPRKDKSGRWVWDVLDGQQRLTTMLLILKCLDEKLYSNQPFPLFELTYERHSTLDFDKITFDQSSPNYDYPVLSTNLDSYYIRMAKNRIDYWFDNEVNNNHFLCDCLKQLLFYTDSSRNPRLPKNTFRAIFIWYNVQPVNPVGILPTSNRIQDIEIFNRLNRGKISLSDSELIKANFLIYMKQAGTAMSSIMDPDTFARTWDEMERKFQNEDFWQMICPKNISYSNRMDLLFDFIKDSNGHVSVSAYRYYSKRMHSMATTPNVALLEQLWDEVKRSFDKLCKWHENTVNHNRIGFLVDCGETVAEICNELNQGRTLENQIKDIITTKKLQSNNDIAALQYDEDENTIRKVLLLFNVLTCDKYGQKFPFDLYRKNSFDIEHVNSQTDNPIDKPEDKQEWIRKYAFPCLRVDTTEQDANGNPTNSAHQAFDLIVEGGKLLRDFKRFGLDRGNSFAKYRTKVESYYAYGNANQQPLPDKDNIGNLTLLNSTINREYKNALFPQKLRILKRSDQEGTYIPQCTKHMFLKYYTSIQGNVSAFNMMRWREQDQKDYVEAIKNTLNIIL